MKEVPEWLRQEFNKALDLMFANSSGVHLFDFDGTLSGVKTPWTVMIVIAPKVAFAKIEPLLVPSEDLKPTRH